MVAGDQVAAIARKIGLITLLTVLRGASQGEGHPAQRGEVGRRQGRGGARELHSKHVRGRLEGAGQQAGDRVSPEQTLIIVKEFAKAGNVTQMTYNGVNTVQLSSRRLLAWP